MELEGYTSTCTSSLLCANCKSHKLQVDWCDRKLNWQLLEDLARPGTAPDLIIDDDNFYPLTPSSSSSDGLSPEAQALQLQLQELLGSWTSAEAATRVSQLLHLLLQLYYFHQLSLLSVLPDERLLFELGTLEVLGCTELFYKDARDPSERRACFGILLQATMPPAVSALLEFVTQMDSSNLCLTAASPAVAGSGSQPRFKLSVAFRVGSASSHTPPELSLQAPPWFSQYLPPFSLPAWDPQAPLMEYVPHLVERLEQHMEQHATAAAGRFKFIEALANLLGPPLEVYIPPKPSAGAASRPSSGSGSGCSSSMSRGGCAAWHVQYDQAPYLLFVELGQRFPEELPVLTLQHIRRAGPEATMVCSSFPWSPRWPPQEMAARLFNFLKQELAKHAAASAGVGLAASEAALPAAAGSMY